MRTRYTRRMGANLVECALVYPTVFLLIVGLIVGAMGIFRYQQIASLAREAARYASVHGGQYAKENDTTAATATDIYNNAIAPNAVALDLSQLNYSVTWNTSNYPYHITLDANNNFVVAQNTVTVTITYHWLPEGYLGGLTMTSTSVMPMSY